MNQNLNLKKKKKEIKNEKKNIKKISIFDVMPEKKTKNEKVNHKVEQPKPQVKFEKTAPMKEIDLKGEVKKPQVLQKPTQNKPENKNVSTKISSGIDNNKANKNLNLTKVNQNRSVSMSLVGTESEYVIITSESKKCKPTDKTQLGKCDTIEITVSDPEKKESGFLKKTHVSYLITTLPINFKVRRRFSDVSWFRQALLNVFPINFIPAVPRKSRFCADTLADFYIQKRTRAT